MAFQSRYWCPDFAPVKLPSPLTSIYVFYNGSPAPGIACYYSFLHITKVVGDFSTNMTYRTPCNNTLFVAISGSPRFAYPSRTPRDMSDHSLWIASPIRQRVTYVVGTCSANSTCWIKWVQLQNQSQIVREPVQRCIYLIL